MLLHIALVCVCVCVCCLPDPNVTVCPACRVPHPHECLVAYLCRAQFVHIWQNSLIIITSLVGYVEGYR